MNQRIQELKEQAFNFVAKQNMCKKEYFWENIRHNPELQDQVDAKFAELIVRECGRVCAKIELDEELSTEADIWDGAMMCRVEIMKHFGVEE